jgi:hypothetical protein
MPARRPRPRCAPGEGLKAVRLTAALRERRAALGKCAGGGSLGCAALRECAGGGSLGCAALGEWRPALGKSGSVSLGCAALGEWHPALGKSASVSLGCAALRQRAADTRKRVVAVDQRVAQAREHITRTRSRISSSARPTDGRARLVVVRRPRPGVLEQRSAARRQCLASRLVLRQVAALRPGLAAVGLRFPWVRHRGLAQVRHAVVS